MTRPLIPLGVLVSLVMPRICPAAEQAPLLVAPRALAVSTGVVIVDLRDREAFQSAHVPGAVHWSWERCTTTAVQSVQGCLGRHGIDGAAPVVVYDQLGRPTPAAGHLLWLAEWAGVPSVSFVEGGFEAWKNAGLPVVSGDVPTSPVTFAGSVGAVTAEQEWLLPRLGQEGVEILDLREGTGWQSFSTPPEYSAGHIPYALPFDAVDLLGPNQGWPDVDAGRATLGSLGPRPGDPISLDATFVLHGSDRDDPRASFGYLLLRYLGIDARMLDGGWKAWRDRGLPVVRIVSASMVYERIATSDAKAEAQPQRPIVTIDLREMRDFGLGHLPGALPLPLHRFAEGFESTVTAAAPGADRASVSLIFYCYGPDCVRSRKACAWAAALGYTDLAWFRGGTEAWREAGLPFHRPAETGAGAATSSPAPGSGSGRR